MIKRAGGSVNGLSRLAPLGVAALFAVACSPVTSPAVESTATTDESPDDVSTGTVTSSAASTAPPTTDGGFRAEADAITATILTLQPQTVTDLGVGDLVGVLRHDQLDDHSRPGAFAMVRAAEIGLERLHAATADLDPDEALSAAVLGWSLQDIVDLQAFRLHENPVNFITGPHAAFVEFMADVQPLDSVEDAEDYIARLVAFRGQVDDLIAALQEREAEGYLPTERSLSIAGFQLGAAIGDGAADRHPLVTDFAVRLADIEDVDASVANGLVARAEAAVDGLVLPAFEDLAGAVGSLRGRADAEPGVWALPDGDAYYAAVLRHFLSTDRAPADLHALGRREVDRIVDELTDALEDLGYDATDLASALGAIRADAGAYPTTTESERARVLAAASELTAAAEAAFTDTFGLSPDTALEIVRPRPGREGGSGAYYRSPPIDGSRNGIYYLSLGGDRFERLTLPTTTYHEGVPGHHFQLSLQRSRAALPLHQRVFDHIGYAEGWGLYAERLAFEAGLYDDDPMGNIGRLQMELLRAARVVADTGIHHLRWSRDDAIAYLVDLGFVADRAAAEVDRYIVWPGQAPAYLVGMLAILEERDRVAEIMGADFDLASFHDMVLGGGSIPLDLLDDRVDAWIEEQG